jgi:hypothetical protein
MTNVAFAQDIDEQGNRLHRLPNDYGPVLIFRGRRVAGVSDRPRVSDSEHWRELHLYRTDRGTWVYQDITASGYRLPGDRYLAEEVESLDEAMARLGRRGLAPELYRQAGIC